MAKLGNQPVGKKESIADRRVKAFEMRKGGASLRAIGDALGVSHKTISEDLSVTLKELHAVAIDSVDELREMELARLDMAMEAIQKMVSKGNLSAIDRWLRAMERRAKLLGLDKPTQINFTHDNLKDMSDDELEAIASGKRPD